MFGSLDFNFDRDQLPPILPEPCWQHLPFECTGVLFFDILIANADRHDENLLVDNGLKPKRMIVFDHDQSLFGGGGSLRGQERLDAIMTRLGVSGGPVTSGNRHCLLDGANTREYFGEWLKRIGSLPDWFIEDVCTGSTNIRYYKGGKRSCCFFPRIPEISFGADYRGTSGRVQRDPKLAGSWEVVLMAAPRLLIAKYVPDLRRMEPKNIGIIVWAADGAVAARFAGEEINGRYTVKPPKIANSRKAYRDWLPVLAPST